MVNGIAINYGSELYGTYTPFGVAQYLAWYRQVYIYHRTARGLAYG